MMSGRVVALALCALTCATLGGCATPVPTTTSTTAPVPTKAPPRVTYRINNASYPTLEMAITAKQQATNQALTQVDHLTQKLGGTLVVILPTTKNTRDFFNHRAIQLSAEITEFTILAFDDDILANARAIESARIFNTVEIVRSDSPDTLPPQETDYKLTVVRQSNGKMKWTMTKRDGHERDLELSTAKLNEVARWNALNISLLNAAADLGAPVTHQPLPAATGPNGVTPPGQTSTGTIFFINADGYALTNAHVIKECKSLKMSLGKGQTAEATTITVDRPNDLALIKLPSHSGGYAHFRGSAALRQGEDVIVFGYPLAGALSSQGNLSTGIISALTGIGDDARMLQITAPIQPGNSGGPLFDTSGHVVGIVSSKLNTLKFARITGDIAQNINFAIKTDVVTNFLDSQRVKYDRAPNTKPMSTADISDRARSFTYMISCQH